MSTNFEKMKSMSVDQLAEWLDKYLAFDDAPHMVWFNEKYCNNCESIMCHYEDSTYEFPYAYCELNNKCKFFPEMDEVPGSVEIVKMWLNSEVEENEEII